MSALAAMWTAEIDGMMARLRDDLAFHIWCDTDYLKALHHIRKASLTYEGKSRLEGRANYWSRARRLGRLPETFDIEKQILTEMHPR